MVDTTGEGIPLSGWTDMHQLCVQKRPAELQNKQITMTEYLIQVDSYYWYKVQSTNTWWWDTTDLNTHDYVKLLKLVAPYQLQEIGILCDLAPPAVSECNTTVVNTNPRYVTITAGADYKQNSLHHNVMRWKRVWWNSSLEELTWAKWQSDWEGVQQFSHVSRCGVNNNLTGQTV